MAIRVLLADDHSVVRAGLRQFMQDEAQLEVVGEAADGAEAVDMARELRPDVVLMDIFMPHMDGISATAAIRRVFPDTEVMVFTGAVGIKSILDAVRAGAIGFLFKSAKPSEVIQALRAAAAGRVQLSPEVNALLMRELRAPSIPEVLTTRETQVMRALASGGSNKDIARELEIGVGTVKTHVSNILAKLGVTSRTQAALYEVGRGSVGAQQPISATLGSREQADLSVPRKH